MARVLPQPPHQRVVLVTLLFFARVVVNHQTPYSVLRLRPIRKSTQLTQEEMK